MSFPLLPAEEKEEEEAREIHSNSVPAAAVAEVACTTSNQASERASEHFPFSPPLLLAGLAILSVLYTGRYRQIRREWASQGRRRREAKLWKKAHTSTHHIHMACGGGGGGGGRQSNEAKISLLPSAAEEEGVLRREKGAWQQRRGHPDEEKEPG